MTLSKLNVAALVLGSALALGGSLAPAFADSGDVQDNRLASFLASVDHKQTPAAAANTMIEGRQARPIAATAPAPRSDVDRLIETRNVNVDDN